LAVSDIDPGNDGSLVIRFAEKEFSAIFPGDIGKKTEALLIQHPDEIRATVLLSPHHGSSTSNSAAFLEAVRPEFLIVSSGYTYGSIFPARGLAEKAGSYGVKMLTTAESGCITIAVNDPGFSVVTGDGILTDKQILHVR
jgi:competence protein ComEC